MESHHWNMLLFMESSRAKFCYDLYCFPSAAVASVQCFPQHIPVIVQEKHNLHRAINIYATVHKACNLSGPVPAPLSSGLVANLIDTAGVEDQEALMDMWITDAAVADLLYMPLSLRQCETICTCCARFNAISTLCANF